MTSVAEGLSYESPRGTVELRDRAAATADVPGRSGRLSWDVIQPH